MLHRFWSNGLLSSRSTHSKWCLRTMRRILMHSSYILRMACSFLGHGPKNLTMLKLSFQLVWASPEESCPSSSFPGQRGHTTASPAMSSPSKTFTSKQQRNYHFKMRLCSNKITFSFRNNTENYFLLIKTFVIKCY